jgi:prepilin-type N-terminal cleavage/methylation domain-containing protein
MARSSSMPGARGFSLLELILVVAILLLFAGVLLRAAGGSDERIEGEDTVNRMDRIEAAIRAYATDVLSLPPDLAALAALPAGVARWGGPYVGDDFDQGPSRLPLSFDEDGFGRAFRYSIASAARAQLRSAGANGVFDDADDFARTVDVTPEWRLETRRRLRLLDAAAFKLNQDLGAPATSVFEDLRAALLAAGYLNDDPRFAIDAFGNPFALGHPDPPALRVTSPVFFYSYPGPAPPLPLCP